MDQTGKARIFENIPSPEIHSSGSWLEDHFAGDCEMADSYIFEDGHLGEFNFTGTWKMYTSKFFRDIQLRAYFLLYNCLLPAKTCW